ncbi:PREDICTED: RCC1 and BTB domain-containing protein 1-like [Acromyrmex echinatior]|uniref:RCC1 and BTB domain-containing protein 1-like n=1 Tax=Acromyrmex echinatior TaxID=103372 RepID=UPI0005810CFA|nr:PREDICTED: RCC1 and BTB domain-containing protein 1-like [Acromyrmex echinatior]
MSNQSPESENEILMSRDELGYQKWLAERSCSTYLHSLKKGEIIHNEHPKKVDYMFEKKIKMLLIDCDLAVILLTEDGEVYHWYDVTWSELKVEYYSQLIDLRYTRIVQSAVGGNRTFIILTDDQKVFYFQTYYFDGISRMKWMTFQKKVESICCGDSFFVVLTEDKRMYTWGKNHHGQLGVSTCKDEFVISPLEVKNQNVRLTRIACGYTHVLALSTEGNIFVWGGNSCGQLGCNSRNDIHDPEKIMITPKPMKMLDIAAMKNMSCAISEEKLIYVWGNCFDQQIQTPVACEYTTLFDMCNAMSARPPTTVKNFEQSEKFKILDDIAKSFNDPNISDLVIKIGEQSIYVNKSILQFRTSYFKQIDQFISLEDGQEVIRLNEFSYVMYNSYFKYLYTGKLEVSLEERFKFLALADSLNDDRFKKCCYREIKKDILDENLFVFYNMAQKYNDKEVEKICFEYFKENRIDIRDTSNFLELDQDIKNIFLNSLRSDEEYSEHSEHSET